MSDVIIVVPVYKSELDALEQFSLQYSLDRLRAHNIVLVGPQSLDRGYYYNHFPWISFVCFKDSCFSSIADYNRLLLSMAFYQQFASHEFMLILQTDAIILRDDLEFWCNQPFDYVGAPWPDGVELYVNLGRFEGEYGKRVKVHVGNGGLSLRRIRKCMGLLQEFGEAISVFDRTGSSEDLFFSFMGALSGDFVLPNEITASRFSLELTPDYYYKVNGFHAPMGGHAWWKNSPQFWIKHFCYTPEWLRCALM